MREIPVPGRRNNHQWKEGQSHFDIVTSWSRSMERQKYVKIMYYKPRMCLILYRWHHWHIFACQCDTHPVPILFWIYLHINTENMSMHKVIACIPRTIHPCSIIRSCLFHHFLRQHLLGLQGATQVIFKAVQGLVVEWDTLAETTSKLAWLIHWWQWLRGW